MCEVQFVDLNLMELYCLPNLRHLYGRLSHSLIRANAHAILTQKVDDLYVLWPGRSRLSLHTNCGFAVMHCPNLLQPTIAAAGIAAARKSCRSD